ncbi:ABC-type sugar transport system permease subunit [Geomicrobium halophilum]|uniref:ABC-type sugar transport system permease subunit n=1 Tax=Geomicrobium halophilum TaxID=549000 RepID=A0A841PUX2_9BACL|nr:sugar ABC transporter permease [Geomicrobium halophilum]MBB6450936.1 ABC-type sugar transport system permease subunit [Geomicrobium halophilum]
MTAVYSWFQKNKLRITPYVFLTPNIILFFTFMIAPIIFIFFISFHEWNIIGDPSFIGLSNYTELFFDSLFWTALGNTLYFTIGVVPISAALGIGGALLLRMKTPFRAFFRAIFFMPVVVSMVATALIWVWMFNPDFGLINEWLGYIGVNPDWLGSTTLAMPAVIIAMIWVQAGYSLVIYLAGVQNVPENLYESAQIDGANKWQQFWNVTLPLLKPTTVFVVIILVINTIMAFDLVYTMTSGGPGNSTMILINYIFRASFEEGAMGYGAALGVVQFILVLAISGISLWLGREKE